MGSALSGHCLWSHLSAHSFQLAHSWRGACSLRQIQRSKLALVPQALPGQLSEACLLGAWEGEAPGKRF